MFSERKSVVHMCLKPLKLLLFLALINTNI